MFLEQWIRFTWNLKNLPKQEPKLFGRAKITLATDQDDLDVLFNTVVSCYKTDPGWNHGFEERIAKIREAMFAKNEEEKVTFYLLIDGKRIVGISGLRTKITPQLVTGVCVTNEYRCRGYGTALLYTTLKHLADAGLEEAEVVTKPKVVAGRYLYPKFGGKMTPVEGTKPRLRDKTEDTFDQPKAGTVVIDDIALTEHAAK